MNRTSYVVESFTLGTLQIAAVGGGFAHHGASEFYARRFASEGAADRWIARAGMPGELRSRPLCQVANRLPSACLTVGGAGHSDDCAALKDGGK
jgi:hypothetical protein